MTSHRAKTPAAGLRTLPHKLQITPSSGPLPASIVFRSAQVPADAIYPQHRHAWGEFVYSFSGVMELRLADRHYLAPPQYGIWLPPEVEHLALNRYEASHASLYVAPERCQVLPRTPCALTVGPLVRALLDHLHQQPGGAPSTAQDERLLQVLLDQLAQAPCAGSYLPGSDDPALGAVLQMLQAHPADPRTLPELARAVHTTARTLMRRCQRDLGMSLAEWRQRLRVVRAMTLLEAGQTVETIALDLGYGSASAFIAMFKRLVGVTPDECRKGRQTSGGVG